MKFFFKTFLLFPKLILFISSYVPLLLIVVFQLLRVSLDALGDKSIGFKLVEVSTWRNLFALKFFYEMTFLIALCILIILSLKLLLIYTKDGNTSSDIKITQVDNINSGYITNYFMVYIFPFITLNMTTIDGIATVFILVLIIGYVYVKNDILYINPILNILFKYNIYSIEVQDTNVKEVILLSKKNRSSLKVIQSVKAFRIGYNVFIEI